MTHWMLVTDDDKTALESCQRVFRDEGYEAVVATEFLNESLRFDIREESSRRKASWDSSPGFLAFQ
jgi:DNA-binding response OmpR family regulator